MTSAPPMAGVAAALGAVGLVDLVVVVGAARARASRHRGARATRGGAALARLGRRIGVPAPPRDLAARLAAAGLPATVSAADVMAAKAGGAVVAALVAAPAAGALPARLALLTLPAAAAAGFLAPDWWLARRARRRMARAGLELADVLDLLRVAVEAGRRSGARSRRSAGGAAGWSPRSCAPSPRACSSGSRGPRRYSTSTAGCRWRPWPR